MEIPTPIDTTDPGYPLPNASEINNVSFRQISKDRSPILDLIDAFLSGYQRERLKSVSPRKTYVFTMGSYVRLLPDAAKAHKFLVWDRVLPDVLAELRNGHADLILDTSLETVFALNRDDQSELAAIYGLMHERNIPPERIILANSNLCAGAVHDRVVMELGIPVPMRLWSSDFGLAFAAERLKREAPAHARLEEHSGPSSAGSAQAPLKHFLFLNRKVKEPRVAALLTLAARVGLDKAHISFIGDGAAKDGEELATILRQYVNRHAGEDDEPVWHHAAAAILGQFPLQLQESRAHQTIADFAFNTVDRFYYDTSLISLVSETQFTPTDSLVITEKTLKPLLCRHPFIVLGDPGTIARLRQLGFRTFAPTIDESYDSIVGTAARLDAILAEVIRIGAFNPEQMASVRRDLSEPADYNFEYLAEGFRTRFASLMLESWEDVVRADARRVGQRT